MKQHCIFILALSISTCIPLYPEYAHREIIFQSHNSGFKDNQSHHNFSHSRSDFSYNPDVTIIRSSPRKLNEYTTTHEFKDYFIARGCSENEILNQRCLYMFENFVKFAQTYSGYKSTIQQLHAELKNLNIIQKFYYAIQGTYCRGLQNRIHFLYKQLNTLKSESPMYNGPIIKDHSLETFAQHHAEYKALTDIYRAYTPSLPNAINKRINAFNDMTKGDYALKCTNKSYTLNNNVKQLLQKHGFDTAPFMQCYGNQLNHALHQESLNLLDRIDHLPYNSVLYDHQEALIDFTVAITDYNRDNLTDKAMTVADFCWTVLDYGQAIAEGAALGVYSAATDILTNPIEATINIVAGKQVLAYQLTKVLYNVADIGITALSNVNQAKNKWNKYTEPLNNIIDAINKKEITIRDVIKGSTAFVVGYKTQGKLLSGLGKFCNTIKQKATRFAQNNISSFTIQQYLSTPEGYLLRGVGKTSCSPSCPNQYEHLKEWLRIKEFTSIIDTSRHGIERLIERGFTGSEVYDLLRSPSFTKLQNDGAIVYIKKIQNNFNIIAFNKTTKKLVTALKNINQKALNDLGKNYGWR